jgi:hypothetical protein
VILSTVDFGWEVMVTIVAVMAILGFTLVVLILRSPRSHHTRVGVFLERDDRDTIPEDEDIPPSEWPTRH